MAAKQSVPLQPSVKPSPQTLDCRLGTTAPQKVWLSSLVRPSEPPAGQLEWEDHEQRAGHGEVQVPVVWSAQEVSGLKVEPDKDYRL